MVQKIKPFIYSFTLLFFGLLAACDQKASQAGEDGAEDSLAQEADPWANAELMEPPAPQLPLAERLASLDDSVNTTWYLLVKSDEDKLAKVLRLTDQLAKLPKHNRATADSLRNLHKKLTTGKLTWEKLTDNALVDAYFNDFDDLIRRAKYFRTSTPGAESCTACTELLNDIDMAYSDDASYIYRYNQYVGELNALIKNNQDSIKILGDKYLAIKQRPAFPDPPVQ